MTAVVAAMIQEHFIDVRDLEPPEPLVVALEAAQALLPGSYLRLFLRHEPFPLYRLLDQDGFRHLGRYSAAGPFEVLIWRAADAAAEQAVGQLVGDAP